MRVQITTLEPRDPDIQKIVTDEEEKKGKEDDVFLSE